MLLSGSAIGYYGDRGDEELDETSAPGTGFLAEVAAAWEASTAPAAAAGVRVAHLRTGIVLAPTGRRAGASCCRCSSSASAGGSGPGTQWMSWISLDDEVVGDHPPADSDVAGPVNLTAPAPVTNAELADTLGDVLHRPTVVPVPAFGPRLLLGGERADALLFEGQRVLPRVLQGDGFAHAHPTLEHCAARRPRPLIPRAGPSSGQRRVSRWPRRPSGPPRRRGRAARGRRARLVTPLVRRHLPHDLELDAVGSLA